MVWGPVGAWFAKRVTEPMLRVVPLESEIGVQFEYSMAMGVRRGEEAWKSEVERLIDENRAEIAAILDDYGVPQLALEGTDAAAGR